MTANYHTQYYAHELTKRCPSDTIEKFASTLMDAKVDLNPYPIDYFAKNICGHCPLTRRPYMALKEDKAMAK